MNTNLEQILSALMNEIDNLVDQKVNQKLAELKKGYAKKVQPLMTVQEAANYLNLSPKTIYKYVQTGKLNYYKPSQRINKNGIETAKNAKLFFKKDELDNYLLNEDYHYYSEEELDKQAQTRIAKSRI
jgi:excisionase family DNA binding protein